MLTLRAVSISALMLLSSTAAFAAPEPAQAIWLEVRVPAPPAPVRADGKVHLAYELHMTNLDPRGRELKLTRLEVVADAGPLLTLEGEALAGVLRQPGKAEGDKGDSGEGEATSGGGRARS